MSAQKSLARVEALVKCLIAISVLGTFLYFTGLWVFAVILLELLYFLLVCGTHLAFGWLWHSVAMLRSGLVVWPALASFGLGVCAWLLARKTAAGQRVGEESEDAHEAKGNSASGHYLLYAMALLAATLSGVDLAQNLATLFTRPVWNAGHRVARQRLESRNNLKQIGMAQHNHVESQSRLPSATAKLSEGNSRLQLQHSWGTMLLPHLDERSLFQEIDLEAHWDAPQNQSAMRTQLPYFLNPAIAPHNSSQRVPLEPYGVIHYAANGRVAGVNSRVRLRDLTDGASNTMMSGEVASRWREWGRPGNWRDARLGINKSPDGFGSPFPGGAHFLQADGAVKFLNENIDPSVLENFANPRDGNVLPQGF